MRRFLFLILLITNPLFSQTNLENAMMDGRFQDAFQLLAKKVETQPTNSKNILALQEMISLFPTLSNTTAFQTACESILASPRSSAFSRYKAREAMMDYHVEFGRIRNAKEIAEKQGFLTNWEILGPTQWAGKADLQFPFPFESSFDDTKPYPDFGERNQFQKLKPFTTIGEFAPFYGRNSRHAICYLKTKVTVKTGGSYILHLQISDPFKLWVNGKPVLEGNTAYDHYVPDLLVRLDLPAGTSKIILKMQRLNAMPSFRLAFLDTNWGRVNLVETESAPAKEFNFSTLQTPDRISALQRASQGKTSSEDLFFLARKDFYDGQMDNYIKLMKRLLNQEPKNNYFKYSYAHAILSSDDFPGSARINKALSYLKEISSLRYAGPTSLLIRNDLKNSRFRDAAERIRNFTPAQKTSPFALLVSFETYAALEWENSLLSTVSGITNLFPFHEESQGTLIDYYDQKKSPAADRLRIALTDRYPYSLDNLGIAQALIFSGRYEETKRILDRLEERCPHLAESRLIRADIALRSGQNEIVQSLITSVIRDFPDNSYFLDMAGRYQLQISKQTDGLLSMQQALDAEPGNLYLADKLSYYKSREAYELQEYFDLKNIPAETKNLFATTEKPDAGAIVIGDEEVLKINRDGSWYRIVRQFVKITGKRGIERWASPSIPFSAQTRVLIARTHLGNGETVDVTEMQRQSGNLVISFPAISEGVVIELSYLIPGQGMDLARGTTWFASDENVFQTQSEPLRNVSYTIVAEKGLPVTIRKSKFANNVTETSSSNASVRIWQFRSKELQPIKEEASLPPLANLIPWVSVSTYPQERELFRLWFNGLADPLTQPNPELDDQLFQFTDNRDLKNSPLQTIRKIHLWISDNIRQSDGNPFQFQHTRRTIDLMSGTVMDKTLLMKSFLQRLGIPSDILLIRPPTESDRQNTPLDMKHFTDSLLSVSLDKRNYLIDFSSKHLPFNELSWEKPGSFYLNMTTGMTGHLPVAASSLEQNLILSSNILQINSNAALTVRGVREYQGYFCLYQEMFEDEDTFELTLNQMENQHLKGLSITNSRFLPKSGTNRSFSITFGGHNSSWILGEDNNRTIPYFGMKSGIFQRYITDMDRKNPLRINFPVSTKQIIICKMDGWTSGALPQNIRLESDFGKHRAEYSLREDGTLFISLSTEIPLQEIPKSRYGEFVDFCKKIRDSEEQEIQISR